jgi:AcrB/AcrD/AcrF family
MIAGMIPMSLALEKGSEQNAPLGRAVIGGMALATFATLLVLPAVFTLLLSRASNQSPSLDPDDASSAHYDPIHPAHGPDHDHHAAPEDDRRHPAAQPPHPPQLETETAGNVNPGH